MSSPAYIQLLPCAYDICFPSFSIRDDNKLTSPDIFQLDIKRDELLKVSQLVSLAGARPNA